MTSEKVQSFMLGDVQVTRIIDWRGPFAPAVGLLPEVPADAWADNEFWLAPDHWEPHSNQAVMALQTWVLRSGGRTVLVDTGMGDGHERPNTPAFDRWHSDLISGLASIQIHPEDVDVVVNTHMHVDHISGNTIGVDGGWVPAFPNAQYYIPAADDAHYGPANSSGRGLQPDDRLIYADSILPVHHAGQSVLWDEFHRIDEHLTLEAAPGHTPGSAVLRVTSGTDRAVFVGDVIHSPLQVLHASCSSSNCADAAQAAATRLRILNRAADERELLVPAHFSGAGAVEVQRHDGNLELGPWATGLS